MKAFLFDLNGTIVDDMSYHEKVWYDLLNNELAANMTWPEVKSNMYGTNIELFERIFGKGKFALDEMKALSMHKEILYQKEFLPHLKLIDGLSGFFEKSFQQNIPMAIGSAAIPFNIDFVIDNLHIHHYFKTIVSADDVILSKPNPETYLKCADQLKVNYADCIVFEDSPKGVEAAARAGMKAVAISTYHPPKDFEHLNNILFFIKDYTDKNLEQLFN
jgi:beta-phosphoglucomutase-like phosphatase (HAD superfamily)